MSQSQRAKAVDAVDVLNDFIIDLIAGVMVFGSTKPLSRGRPVQMGLNSALIGFACLTSS